MFFKKPKSTVNPVTSKLKQLFGFIQNDDQFFEQLEEIFLEGDLGPRVTMELLEELQVQKKNNKLKGPEDLVLAVQQLISQCLKTYTFVPESDQLSCMLVLGVNGVGKTTSIAKLAHYYRAHHNIEKIVLAAGDTFRAAATEQLVTHGQRLGFRVVSQGAGADPGAVLYDAIESAKSKAEQLVIADTAGRLHNKANLVKELQKIDKILTSKIAPDRYKRFLVLDSTTGQNGFQQAQVFHEALSIDGVILTKYDSSARGGLAVSVARQLGIPVAFVGTGETMEDLHPFVVEDFTQRLVEGILA
jgi:fused signal recognition particle receptor